MGQFHLRQQQPGSDHRPYDRSYPAERECPPDPSRANICWIEIGGDPTPVVPRAIGAETGKEHGNHQHGYVGASIAKHHGEHRTAEKCPYEDPAVTGTI